MHAEDDRARAEEQQPFKHRMVHQVVKRAKNAERRQHRMAGGNPHHADADTHQNNPDVFHGVPGQQAFDVVLCQRIQHAQHRRNRTERQHHNPPPQLSGE